METGGDIIEVEGKWYVLATSSRADDRSRVLKHGDTFSVYDRHGDAHHAGLAEQGLYHHGTRHLSVYTLTLEGMPPMLLNSTVSRDNNVLAVALTVPDVYRGGHLAIARGTAHVSRQAFLLEAVHYERLRCENYGPRPTRLTLELTFGADFADIFEVRGVRRERRGRLLAPELGPAGLTLAYIGLDGVRRSTRIAFSRRPAIEPASGLCRFALDLPPHGAETLELTVACIQDGEAAVLDHGAAWRRIAQATAAAEEGAASVHSSNEQFNDWLNRSSADLRMLVTQTPHGPYPYAGVPWFSTVFGRDGIITAMQRLWLDPALARGVLAFLAEHQAQVLDATRDAEPGKILHEMRSGEMAAMSEVPFGRYYGTVDATPLFVLLAGRYYERTGDRPFIESIWPCIERALAWIEQFGDSDGDGFVEYQRNAEAGLVNQGWKDSDDSVFHHDGMPAAGPIALCEVQGYVYEAWLAAARLARLLGEAARARAHARDADELKARFNAAFWCEERAAFALALDGGKRPCAVVASNMGHALFTGVAESRYARRAAQTLMSPAMFAGWGVRTLAAGEARYNPMSYHNGSIWPHDNAIVASGLARYGFREEAARILTGLFDASLFMDLHRLPELMCGFERLPDQGPTSYPVACSPQAWASGAVFQLLESCLGLRFTRDKPQLRLHYPVLPAWLQSVEIRNLAVGAGSIDLELRRHERNVSVNVLRKDGGIDVAVIS